MRGNWTELTFLKSSGTVTGDRGNNWLTVNLLLILLYEKFLQFDWLRAVVFQLNLKYLHVKITNLLRVVGINTTRDISKLSQISLA